MENVKHSVDQKLVEGQEKLHQMWLSWNQKQLQGPEKELTKPEVSMGDCGVARGTWSPDAALYTFASWAHLL